MQCLQLRELLEGRSEGASEDSHRGEFDHVRDLREVGVQQGVPSGTHENTLR